ncbi:hypothetical protein F4824DRAFT_445144 [Ustulina deusta]|nr:hypothetical protein F4823DRAFT_583211 [Ustulina deusta]KAI3342124.1 hypothetical protein F4824DRAFT_445144 [Ustulina deusta]
MGLLSLYKTKERDLPRTYAYTVSSDSLTTTTMSTTSYSTSDSRPTSRHYETGFPDSFASCTTSMRHPDAILDPGFAISAEHIDPAKTLHRSRKSLLRKHRRTISYGKINEGTLGQNFTERPHSRLSAADSATELVDQKSHDLAQPSKAGAESPSRAKGSESILGISPGFQYTDDGEHDGDERRRNKIFRKLMNKP